MIIANKNNITKVEVYPERANFNWEISYHKNWFSEKETRITRYCGFRKEIDDGIFFFRNGLVYEKAEVIVYFSDNTTFSKHFDEPSESLEYAIKIIDKLETVIL